MPVLHNTANQVTCVILWKLEKNILSRFETHTKTKKKAECV